MYSKRIVVVLSRVQNRSTQTLYSVPLYYCLNYKEHVGGAVYNVSFPDFVVVVVLCVTVILILFPTRHATKPYQPLTTTRIYMHWATLSVRVRLNDWIFTLLNDGTKQFRQYFSIFIMNSIMSTKTPVTSINFCKYSPRALTKDN